MNEKHQKKPELITDSQKDLNRQDLAILDSILQFIDEIFTATGTNS